MIAIEIEMWDPTMLVMPVHSSDLLYIFTTLHSVATAPGARELPVLHLAPSLWARGTLTENEGSIYLKV